LNSQIDLAGGVLDLIRSGTTLPGPAPYDEVIELLEVEGVQKFENSYAQLASAISMQLTGCIA
jgi:hypothetical protein